MDRIEWNEGIREKEDEREENEWTEDIRPSTFHAAMMRVEIPIEYYQLNKYQLITSPTFKDESSFFLFVNIHITNT